jgi:hypothetical protein
MTPPPDLIECTNCDCWFTGESPDEVFCHATARCRRDKSPVDPPSTQNG